MQVLWQDEVEELIVPPSRRCIGSSTTDRFPYCNGALARITGMPSQCAGYTSQSRPRLPKSLTAKKRADDYHQTATALGVVLEGCLAYRWDYLIKRKARLATNSSKNAL